MQPEAENGGQDSAREADGERGGGTLDHPSGGTTTEAAQRQEHESPYEGRDSRLGLPRRRLASQVS